MYSEEKVLEDHLAELWINGDCSDNKKLCLSAQKLGEPPEAKLVISFYPIVIHVGGMMRATSCPEGHPQALSDHRA